MTISPNDVNYVQPRTQSNELRFSPTAITELGTDLTLGSSLPGIRSTGNAVRYLEGAVEIGATPLATGELIAVLPAGFGAQRAQIFNIVLSAPGGVESTGIVRLEGNTIVAVPGSPPTASVAGTFIRFDGIVYISE